MQDDVIVSHYSNFPKPTPCVEAQVIHTFHYLSKQWINHHSTLGHSFTSGAIGGVYMEITYNIFFQVIRLDVVRLATHDLNDQELLNCF